MNEAQPLNALPPGYRLQEYELVRVLGFGGFGMTYLGFDHNLDKAVAIKEYLPSDIAIRTGDNSVTPQATQFQEDFAWGLARFLDEARALARFDHRHIIKVYRFFEAHGTAYIVMEYAEGETLSAYLERKGTLNEAELKAILYPLLDGLDVVHRADFLHRDIKPGNIIIRDEDGSPVLLDFGAARQAIGSRSRSVTSIITPGYAPIEQYSSRGNQGSWTDIYALGGVCYRALTGEVPDDATDRMRNDPLVPLVDRCAGRASAGFLSAIDRALSVDEGDRPQSIGEWRVALGKEAPRIKNVQPSVPPPAPAPQAKEQRQEPAASEKQREDEVAEIARLEAEEEKFVAEVGHKPSPSGVNDKGMTDLHFAASRNLDMIALSLLNQGADVHAKTDAGYTSLHWAAYHNARVTAELLLDSGANVHAKNNDGRTPLHVAAHNNVRATARLLLDHGADVQAKDNDGNTPLHIAVVNDDREMAEMLLKHGADVDAKDDDGNTPLHDAMRNNRRATAELLRKHGADVQAKNNLGYTPLNCKKEEKKDLLLGLVFLGVVAVLIVGGMVWLLSYVGVIYTAEETEKQRQEQVALEKQRQEEAALKKQRQELAAEEAKFVARVGRKPSPSGVSDNDVTDLHIAASLNLDMVTQSLLDRGSDIHAKDNLGNTPLHDAASNKARETVEVLLKHGADVRAKDNEGNTPLHEATYQDAGETAELLLKHGADVNAKNNRGRMPLYWAAIKNAGETAELLLKHGADVNAKEDTAGRTPLHEAAIKNAGETAELLLKHGADVRAKDKKYGFTPLHVAAGNNARAVAELLLKHGADVNAKGEKYGFTSLHLAAGNNARAVAELLLDQGANVNAETDDGWTPLDVGVNKNAHETAALLRRYGGRM